MDLHPRNIINNCSRFGHILKCNFDYPHSLKHSLVSFYFMLLTKKLLFKVTFMPKEQSVILKENGSDQLSHHMTKQYVRKTNFERA